MGWLVGAPRAGVRGKHPSAIDRSIYLSVSGSRSKDGTYVRCFSYCRPTTPLTAR
jgi:hypothetical protein